MDAQKTESENATAVENMPGQGLLDSFLVAIRVVGSIGAVCAIVLGVVFAIQLFSFFRGIIDDPSTTIASWQIAMDQQRPRDVQAHVPDAGVPPTVQPMVAPEPGDQQRVVDEGAVPRPVDIDEPQEVPESTRMAVPVSVEEVPPMIILAERIMDRLETGSYSWLIGVGVLVVFCWLLLKIPIMLITLGTRLLLGLVNVSAEG